MLLLGTVEMAQYINYLEISKEHMTRLRKNSNITFSLNTASPRKLAKLINMCLNEANSRVRVGVSFRCGLKQHALSS